MFETASSWKCLETVGGGVGGREGGGWGIKPVRLCKVTEDCARKSIRWEFLLAAPFSIVFN